MTSMSATCLGLEASLVSPFVESIGQLPEVATVLERSRHQRATTMTKNGKEAIDSLRRAGDIFASFQLGGNEHRAVLALLAEVQQEQGDYKGASSTMDQILQFVSEKERIIDVTLAMSKTLWMQGQIAESRELLNNSKLVDDATTSSPLHAAAVENSILLSTLILEGPIVAKGAAQATNNLVQNQNLPPLAQVALQLNLGVIEALHGDVIECEGDTCLTRFDTARDIWKSCLDILQKADAPENNGLAYALEGRIQSNLAWTGLEIGGRDEAHVSEASESARLALKALEHESLHGQEGLTRALSLVAQCYHRAHHAVTAEGLFQSALDYKAVSPQQYLERIVAYQAYADLCKDWDKRQGEADKLLAKSLAIRDSSLPGEWKDMTELHSSLWFWTPGLFREI